MLLKAAQFFFLACLFLSVWAGSGTRPSTLFAMLFAASIAFVCALWDNSKEPLISKQSAFKNPFALAGAVLILLCLIQTFNPDLVVFQNKGYQQIEYIKHVELLPSGILRDLKYDDTFLALQKLLALWCFAMCGWKLLRGSNFAQTSLNFFVLNGTFMALLAIFQKAANMQKMFGIVNTSADFYGTFFLANAAGDFLVSICACALACAYLYFKKNRGLVAIAAMLASAICAYATMYSDSKGAQLSLIIFAAICISYTVYKIFRKFISPALSALCLVLFLAISTSGIFLLGEDFIVKRATFELTNVNSSVIPRLQINRISYKIFKSAPVCGVGGGSYGVRVQSIASEDNEKYAKNKFINSAHNDFFEYLCEFGIVGGLAIILCFAIWLRQLFAHRKTLCAANAILIAAIIASALHSLVDLHLHIPSTMMAFVLLMILSATNFKGGKIRD